MIELKEYQKKAVKQLKENILDMLSMHEDRQKIVFKAPTGSGKTVCASALLDELNMELSSTFNEVAFIWIAPNKLHVQTYLSMRNFFSESRTLRPIFFDDVNPSEGLNPGEVLFLNWESINKENAVIIRDNEQNRTLYRLTKRTQENGLPIIVIIDEEHMFGNRNAKKSELVLKNINPKIELRISATPTTSGCPLVNIPRQKVIDEEMIKKGIQLNPQVKGSNAGELTVNEQLIEDALRRRESLARAYREFNINPLLLIQLPNDNNDTLSAEEKKTVDEIIQYLDVKKNITVDNNKLAVWLSGRKENVLGIEKPDCMTEVLLFKQAIALGWDCPRACVLLIFRELQSQTFTTQTVGRILRMPQQRHYTNDVLNYGYVYTNLSTDMIEIVRDDMNYISKIPVHLKRGIVNIQLNSVYQNRRKTPHVLMSPFKEEFKRVVSEIWDLPNQELFVSVGDWNNLVPSNLFGEVEGQSFTDNRRKAQIHGIQTDVSRIMVKIPRDLMLTGEEERVTIDERASFARTQSELLTAFNDFCRKNVGDFEPGQSAEMIRSAVYEFFEEYLGMDQNDAIKVVLYHLNKAKFAGYIKTAEDRYSRDYERRERERDATEYKDFVWELPETRVYNTETCVSREGEIFNHALIPFFEEKNASGPEIAFSRLLDQQNEYIDWWYKNADSGHMHFAVPYTDIEGEPRCFYVDYIIRLKNGTVCLFDTKTPRSDPNAPAKHNALLEYMKRENEQNYKRLVGGVIMQENDNWFYSPLPIDNTSSTSGWTMLDFSAINVEPR